EGGHVALHHRAPLAHRPGRAGQPGAEQPEHVVGQVECGDLASGGQQREGEPAGARGQIEYRAVTGGAHGADDVPDLEAVGGGEVVVEGGALVVVEAAEPGSVAEFGDPRAAEAGRAGQGEGGHRAPAGVRVSRARPRSVRKARTWSRTWSGAKREAAGPAASRHSTAPAKDRSTANTRPPATTSACAVF